MIEVPIEMEVSTSYQPRTSGVSDYSVIKNYAHHIKHLLPTHL